MPNIFKENGFSPPYLLLLISNMAEIPSQPRGEYRTIIPELSNEMAASLTQPTELALNISDHPSGYDITCSTIMRDYLHGTRVRIGNHLV